MPKISRILCPVDFSPCSDLAADYAIELASQLGAAVYFLHAWEVPVYAVPDGALAFNVDVMMRIDEAMKSKLDALLARYADRKVELHGRVLQGMPALEIVRRVDELHIDLVVMGTHGRTGLSHLFLGSVAERVVRTAHVPVLTVPMAKT